MNFPKKTMLPALPKNTNNSSNNNNNLFNSYQQKQKLKNNNDDEGFRSIMEMIHDVVKDTKSMMENNMKEISIYRQESKMMREKYLSMMGEGIRYGGSGKSNERQYSQVRFQSIDVPIPQNISEVKQQRQQGIIIWLSQVLKTVFSTAFYNFKTSQLDQKKLKIFCSQNIIRNLIKFSRTHQLSFQQMLLIDKALKTQLIPYYKLSYPESQQTKVNTQFENTLIQRDLINQNQYDYIHKSMIKFEYKKNGNYNKEIMMFFNYLMKSVYKSGIKNMFYQDMESFFSIVYHQNQMYEIYSYDPKKLKEETIKKQKIIKKNQSQKQKYIQKVQSYTNYLIGQKLSDSTHTFSQFEIQSGNLKLQSSAQMRIITKWCQQLQKNFDEQQFFNRQTPFRMKNGQEFYIQSNKLRYLNYLLQKQKKQTIQAFIQQISLNNYIHQSILLEQKSHSSMKIFLQEQAMVGQFNSFIFKNNKTYLGKYLNVLIHAINKAVKNYTNYEYALRNQQFQMQNCQLQGVDLFNKIEQRIKMPGSFHQPFLSTIPQLISFRIGDLLRCKCSSKSNQIIALYKQAQIISNNKPNQFKIIRVKNRLSKGNKDILMNILYKNEIIIEMQLAIKQDKSKFIDCSNKFNHYLYELQRAKFGSVMQMCSVWMSLDNRAQFYAQKKEKLNVRVKMQSRERVSECCVITNYKTKNKNKIINLPFICNYCNHHYSESGLDNQHIKCIKCNKFCCFLCKFQSCSSITQKINSIRHLKQNKFFIQQGIYFTNKIPQIGGLISKFGSISKRVFPFFSIKQNNKYYVFEYNDQTKQIKQIANFKTATFSTDFLKQNMICTSTKIQQKLFQDQLKLNNKNKQAQVALKMQQAEQLMMQPVPVLKSISLDSNNWQKTQNQEQKPLTQNKDQKNRISCEPILQHFLQKYLQEINRNQKSSVTIVDWNLKPQLLKKQRYNTFDSVKKINCSQNQQFGQISILIDKFPRVQLALLNKIGLCQLSQHPWQNITHLYLSKNNLTSLKNIGLYAKLQILDLSHNKIQQIPDQIQNLTQLTKLSLYNNDLHFISSKIGRLLYLQSLNVTANKQLKQLPNQINQLRYLEQLMVQYCALSGLPQKLDGLKKLKMLTLTTNKITKLSSSIGQLISLKKFAIDDNLLQNIPDEFGNLCNLEELLLDFNKIKQLPKSIGNLKSLRLLYIFGNQLTSIPKQIQNLCYLQKFHTNKNKLQILQIQYINFINLKQLIISNNKIKQISLGIGSLTNLVNLNMENNMLRVLPKEIGNLTKLQNLVFLGNKIISIPVEIGQLSTLRAIRGNNNIIQQLPQQLFYNLTRLNILYLSNNKISKLPNSLWQINTLQFVDFNKNKLQNLSPQIQNLYQLKQLNISQNNLKQLPQQLYNACLLRKLVLYSTKISVISNQIKNLTELEELYISSNQFKELPQQLFCLQKLIKLDINYNNGLGKNIPEGVSKMKNIQQLYFLCKKSNGQEIQYIENTTLPAWLINMKKLKLLQINREIQSNSNQIIKTLTQNGCKIQYM